MIWVWSVVLRDKNETSMFQDEVSSDDIYRRPKRGKAAKTTCLLLKGLRREKSGGVKLYKDPYLPDILAGEPSASSTPIRPFILQIASLIISGV